MWVTGIHFRLGRKDLKPNIPSLITLTSTDKKVLIYLVKTDKLFGPNAQP